MGMMKKISYWIDPAGNEIEVPLNHSASAAQILSTRGLDLPADEARQALLDEGWIRVSEMETFEFRGLDQSRPRILGFVRARREVYEEFGRLELDDQDGEDAIVALDDFLG